MATETGTTRQVFEHHLGALSAGDLDGILSDYTDDSIVIGPDGALNWDPEFGKSRFAPGYHDRVAGEQRIVPFASIRFDADRPGFFSIEDADGMIRHIPLHRVRTVYKDGVVIWERP
jgi:uncharacterized protein (UPF0248 family)